MGKTWRNERFDAFDYNEQSKQKRFVNFKKDKKSKIQEEIDKRWNPEDLISKIENNK